jgi:L-2-hydroxyglutarate oxidase LhgO
MPESDLVIIGAGVIGLSISAEISKKYNNLNIVVFEKERSFGDGISSRNSEVIHSGIYYPKNSFKADLCVKGNKKLYKFCEEFKIPYKKTGKLILAKNKEEIPALEDLYKNGINNNVGDLVIYDKEKIKKAEPLIKAEAAIFSPSTGIINTHKLMEKLEKISINNNVLFAYSHKVINIQKEKNSFRVSYLNSCKKLEILDCRWIINSSGLYSDEISKFAGIDTENSGYRIYPCKGEYYNLKLPYSCVINHLVYPVPNKNLKSLGIHLTKTLDNRVRLGPNAYYTESKDNYDIDEKSLEEFFYSTRVFLPFIEKSWLTPDMAGIRPKLQKENEDFRDFIINSENDKGLEGFINLVGIESPGLTACLSVAEKVREIFEANT